MEQITFDQLPHVVAEIREDIALIKRILSEKSCKKAPLQDQRLTLNNFVEYVKEATGIEEISKATIYNKSSQGKIPSHKFNNRLIFYKSEVDKWIESEFMSKAESSSIGIQLPKK